MYFVFRKRWHNFDELCKLLGHNDLFFLTAVLSNDLKQILLILILSDNVKMPHQSQHYFLDIFICLLVQISNHLYQIFLVGPKIQTLEDLF